MVILNIFGKIEEFVISKKLGITISNLPDDWKEGIQEEIKEELYQREFDINKYSKFSPNIKNYLLSEILSDEYYAGVFNVGVNDDENIDEIANKLICIQIGDFKSSLLCRKNEHIDNPTCEDEFEYKFINFFQYIATHNRTINESAFYSPRHIYYSWKNDNKPGILSSLELYRLRRKAMAEKLNYLDVARLQIQNLLNFGEIIDSYLENDEDFFELDYLIHAVYCDNNYDAYHLFKLVSLVEMLILNPKNNGKTKGEIERKLPMFIQDNNLTAEEEKREFSTLIRVIRNKIGDGDFKKLHIKLEEYAERFMKDYWFDYCEYSRINWIYLSLGCKLIKIVSTMIWNKLVNKQEMIDLKNS
jgi:hypothetical protein